jgi:hypothetical protein
VEVIRRGTNGHSHCRGDGCNRRGDPASGVDRRRAIQGNVYDQFTVYVPGSVVFHQYDYATVMSATAGAPENPVVVRAGLALK